MSIYIAHRCKKKYLMRSMCRVLIQKTSSVYDDSTKTVKLHVRLTQIVWNKIKKYVLSNGNRSKRLTCQNVLPVKSQNVPPVKTSPWVKTSHVHGQNVPCAHGHSKRCWSKCRFGPSCYWIVTPQLCERDGDEDEDVTYEVINAGSQKEKRKLVDSFGFSYTVKREF